jgi:hypothetical protein
MLAVLLLAAAILLPAPQEALPRDLMGYTLGGTFDPSVQNATASTDSEGNIVYELVNSEGAVVKVGTDRNNKIIYLALDIMNPSQDTIDHFLGEAIKNFGAHITTKQIGPDSYNVVFNDGKTENRIVGNSVKLTIILSNA